MHIKNKEYFKLEASIYHTAIKYFEPSTWKQTEKLTKHTSSPEIWHPT